MADESIRAAITDIRRRLTKGQYPDVERTKWGIVERLLRCLGWDVLDCAVVESDYSVGPRAVDFALLDPQSAPAVLVEIEEPGGAVSDGVHGFDHVPPGNSILVNTTGRHWAFSLVGAQGSDRDGPFCVVDLVDRSVDEAAESLLRYLRFDSVRAGEAVGQAAADHREASRRRQVAETLPSAWRALLTQPNETLAHLLEEEVERRCGVRPPREETERFLVCLPGGAQPEAPAIPQRKRPDEPSPHRITGTGQFSFTFDGETRRFKAGKELLIAAFVALATRDPTLCQRFHERYRGKRRSYLARRREDLYPGQSGLDVAIGRLPGGWFIGTNMGSPQKAEMIRRACDLARIDFRDLRIEMPVRIRKPKQW